MGRAWWVRGVDIGGQLIEGHAALSDEGQDAVSGALPFAPRQAVGDLIAPAAGPMDGCALLAVAPDHLQDERVSREIER